MPSSAYILASLIFSSFTLATPPSLLILNTHVLDCTYNISSQLSSSSSRPNPSNTTTIDILFDTSLSTNGTADALAWTDSGADAYGALCTVCVELGLGKDKGSSNGSIVSLDYDFFHRLDPGLLEQVTSFLRRPRDAGEQWFESSYIYGSTDPDTRPLQRVQENIPIASDPLFLGLAGNVSETLCLQTSFAVYNRVGVNGANGEISRRSVFRLGVNVEWQG